MLNCSSVNCPSLLSRQTREERKAEAIMHVFENLDKRKRRATLGGASTGGGAEEAKQEGSPFEEGAVNPSGGNPAPHSTGTGVSTRRTTYVSVSWDCCHLFFLVLV